MNSEEAKKELKKRQKIISEIFEQHPTFRFKDTMDELNRILLKEKENGKTSC